VHGAAGGVAGAEEAVDRHQAVVAPLALGGRVVFWTAGPGTRAGGVRAHHVRLGSRQLRADVLGVDIQRGPHHTHRRR